MDIAFETATSLAEKIRTKKISSRELTDHYIARIEKYDGAVNAVVVRDFEGAQAAADAADKALAEGRTLGPLHGLPMTIKEAFDIAGLPTTWGLPPFADNIAKADSEAVRRLKAAGAHFLGKTNVPLNLADFQSYNDIYGTTNNPWNLERTPGGSSGGSAAALAAGMTALEMGSDIGGSIRNPAHFCGLYGHKPTWGTVPPQGHALPGVVSAPDIAVVGPLARGAEDLALMMDVVAGPEPLNARGWKLDLPRPDKKSLKDYRVAIWANEDRAKVSTEISDRAHTVGERLAKLGAKVSDTARPAIDLTHTHLVYLYLLNGVIASGLPDEQFEQSKELAAAFDKTDTSFEAVMTRAGVQHHRDWIRIDNAREILRQKWRAFFEEWDILICPQMATAAFPHDHSDPLVRTLTVDNEERPYFEQIFWAGLVTASYLPSTVFPTGPGREGLPIGLQAVSAEYNDYITIDFAGAYAREFGGFVPPPGY